MRLAVVGDIGSGKSYVAKQFGYPVFNADAEVAKLYRKSRKCYSKLKKSLPNYITSFPVKKSELFEAIMGGENNLNKIVKIVHPEVQFRMNNFKKKNKKLKKTKKKKIDKKKKKKPNFNTRILKKFKELQLPIEFKKRQSNFVIKNNFKNNSIKENVKKVLEKIL